MNWVIDDVTFAERVALKVARAVLGVFRWWHGETNNEDAWARYQELAASNNWDAHQCALACYLAFGSWQEVQARVIHS